MTYQPIYALVSGDIVGMEALICWDHPKYGLISPTLFIPIAEETGMIDEIGEWMIKTVCKDYASMGEKVKNKKICINISSRQLLNAAFFDVVKSTLKDNNINPKNIEFELTESVIMGHSNDLFNKSIMELDALGIKISIDDFGTGYSSLMRLKHLPISTLKIEQSFVQDAVKNLNGSIIVNCIIALGKSLKLDVIAEGVETKKQLDFLIEKGCQYGQGYYMSKSLKLEELKKLIKTKEKKRVD
jgi:EAL domain-containing protein (putative c-di-GMP-specific phosphodiesterase class I)